MHYVTRRERFNAAHRIFKPELSDEENFSLFGKCANPHWHGHNYIVYVTIRGVVDPADAYLMDLKDLKKIIHEYVIDKVDHRNLNIEVDFLQGVIPSAENLVRSIFEQLYKPINALGVELYSVKLYETENNICEYRLD